jgi:hypothetical protein
LYIADTLNHRIQKFDDRGVYKGCWGEKGDGNGEFRKPSAITVYEGNDGKFIYVADNARVQKFDLEGNYIHMWGSTGSEDGNFYSPAGIATDAAGFVYVADTANHRIQKFDSDGKFLLKWGKHGSGPGEFNYPSKLAVDNQGHVYVADTENHRIQKFTAKGEFITEFGEFGSGAGQLNSPAGICVNSDGSKVYVSDAYSRIQIFKKARWTGGKAIIVAGTTGAGDKLWDATKMNANFAYHTLNYQGFPKENIYYLTSDTELDLDSNGLPDDVKPVTNEILKEAITVWAKGAEGLILYIVDHGGEDSFVMSDKDTLNASDLASWLDQAEISGKIIVVYDACYSGTFLAPLSVDNKRIVMTSASPKQKAFFPRQGSVSFSNYFWTHIFNGFDVNDAFSRSDDGMSTYQNPLMDADGNKTANEDEDFTLAQGNYIGNGTVIQGDGPVIGSVSREQNISGVSSATLEAFDVTDDDGIAHVWAVIIPPRYNQEMSDGTVKEMPSVDLMPVGDNKYAGTYDGFNVEDDNGEDSTGDYQIVIYARDSDGNISVPKLTSVSVKNPLRRRAVIVAGVSQSDDLWPVIEKNVRLAYTALRVQGYPDEDIYLMSEASISDVPVNPIEPTLSSLNHALGVWAEENTQDMMLYMIGRGFDGVFYVNQNETLTAAQLDAYLDNLQANISGTIAVVYDACRSGSFISALIPPQGKKRIVICSATENQPAAFIPNGYLSFSNFFWQEILHGECVMKAFNKAKDDIFYLTGERQVSYIDDNGNGVPNEGSEGDLAKEYDIGIGVLLADNTPDAETFSADQMLQGARSANIWVENVSGAYKVLAIIAPPEDLSADMDKACDFNLVTLELNEAGEGRYETVYDHFEISGSYDIKFCKVDSEGKISTLTSAKITKQSGNDIYEPDNEPAQASIIVINDTSQKHNFYEAEDADWLKFYGLSGTTYEIKASKMAENCNVIIELYESDGETKLRDQNTLGYPQADEILTWDCERDGAYYLKLMPIKS